MDRDYVWRSCDKVLSSYGHVFIESKWADLLQSSTPRHNLLIARISAELAQLGRVSKTFPPGILSALGILDRQRGPQSTLNAIQILTTR